MISFEVKQLVLKYNRNIISSMLTQFWGKVLPVFCCKGQCLAAIAFAVGTSPRSIYSPWAILVRWFCINQKHCQCWCYLGKQLLCMDHTVVKVTKFICLSLVTRALCLENNPGYRQGVVTSVFNFSLQNLLNPFWFMLEKTR